MNAENWCVYLILCENGAFYCGISNRPQERFAAHSSGKGAKYTRLNKPIEMRIVSDGLNKMIKGRLKHKPNTSKREQQWRKTY